jgi:flagellar basal-body rod protein FlgG
VPVETASVVVTEAGHIAALDEDGDELAATDIPIYTFINPAGLKAMGKNLYQETDASGAATAGTPGTDNVGTVAQGYLVMSNVEIVDEMVAMIVGQRAYEINSKAVQTSDAMLQTANQLKR